MNDEMSDYDILLMDVQRSIRYHDRRNGFYQGCLGLFQFIILMMGTATVATFGAEIGSSLPNWVRLLPSVLASAAVSAMLVFRLGDKAWLHFDLKRDFSRLEQRLELIRSSHTQDQVSEIQAERLAIEAREPRVRRVLDTICDNELKWAMGYEKSDLAPIGFWQRWMAQFFDVNEEALRKRAEVQP